MTPRVLALDGVMVGQAVPVYIAVFKPAFPDDDEDVTNVLDAFLTFDAAKAFIEQSARDEMADGRYPDEQWEWRLGKNGSFYTNTIDEFRIVTKTLRKE